MSKIFTTTLRLNLEKEADRRAFAYLRRLDKRQFRSYSGAIVTAVNAYFENQERIAANPGYRGGHVLVLLTNPCHIFDFHKNSYFQNYFIMKSMGKATKYGN